MRLLVLTTSGLLVLAACNLQGLTSAPNATARTMGPRTGDVAVIIEGQAMTIAEVYEHIQNQFLKEFLKLPEERRFEMSENAIRAIVQNHIIEAEANKQGKTSQEVLDEIAAVPEPTTQDIGDWFTKNKSRMRASNLEDVSDQIKDLILEERRGTALREFVDPKLAALSWKMVLSRPRREIEATRLSRGPADAPVTIITFSDYQCPYCVLAEPILAGVLERYPNQVRLVHRHFPLDRLHPFARPAAEASMCADQQGKFWGYHEGIFARNGKLGGDALVEIAAEVGLDADEFDSCLEERRYKDFVETDFAAGREAGVTGTPSFFLNGIKLKGALSVDDLSGQVDLELARLQLQEDDSKAPNAE